MITFTLQNFFPQLTGRLGALPVKGLSDDSRQVQSDELYFLNGDPWRWPEYIAQAKSKNIIAAVIPKQFKLVQDKIPLFEVEDIQTEMARCARIFYATPTSEQKLWGVTGTNGKTTLTYLLRSLLGTAQTGIIGTIGAKFGETDEVLANTTPHVFVLHHFLRKMANQNIQQVALEVSSHALAQKRVHECLFDVGIFTNLTQDHLDYHQNLEQYFFEKSKLFTQYLNPTRGVAVLNNDDPFGKKLAKMISTPVLWYSYSDAQSDAYVKNVEFNVWGSQGLLSVCGEDLLFKTSLIGRHNIMNLLAAILAVKGFGLKPAIENLNSVFIPGRLQRVGRHPIFVDYAHTPDALKNVLLTLRQILLLQKNKGRLLVVFGCGGNRDATKRQLMGHCAWQLADLAVVTSDNPRQENPLKIMHDICLGFPENEKLYCESDRYLAIKYAIQQLTANDILLIAGKGHENYQIIGTKKINFDDVLVAKSLLGD